MTLLSTHDSLATIILIHSRLYQGGGGVSLRFHIPLSPYSKSFWIEYQINPKRSDYNMVLDQTLSGDLDISRLRQIMEPL